MTQATIHSMSRISPKLAAYAFLWAAADAATLQVEPGHSVQAAIDRAAAGDVIVIADGVYHEALNVHKAITLKAGNPGTVTITNKHPGPVNWQQNAGDDGVWYAEGIDWEVICLRVDGLHAFDHRTPENFHAREAGPFWSKGWQAKKKRYDVPPVSFAHDTAASRLWLRLHDGRDPNRSSIEFHRGGLDGRTLLQKDLGTAENQQEIVLISSSPSEYPVLHDYSGLRGEPPNRRIDYPKVCGRGDKRRSGRGGYRRVANHDGADGGDRSEQLAQGGVKFLL